MADEKLFVVTGKSENLMFKFPGGDAMVPLSEIDFIMASSAQEAIGKVLNAKNANLEDYGRKVEKFLQEGRLQEEMRNPLGELGLFPPSKPIDKENWRAEEVKVPGYKIILEPI